MSNTDSPLDEIYNRMNDYTIFHSTHDGDFESPGETYISWSEAKKLIELYCHKQVIEALEPLLAEAQYESERAERKELHSNVEGVLEMLEELLAELRKTL